jgi:Methylamine utilization protein MauJ
MIWLNVAVKPHFQWPNAQVELSFENKRIVLQPPTVELACVVSSFDSNGITFENGGTILGHFLSRLSWSMGGGLEELFYGGSNNPNHPGRLGPGGLGSSSRLLVDPWEYLYFPVAGDPRADLGLALFREGMNVNSAPFAFLSFFKIINIIHGKGSDQQAWINNNLTYVGYPPAIDRLNEIMKVNSNVGEYLYVQGRCAIAHAFGTPIVNPDVYQDKYRLEQDLPLMKELAVIFVERELGVMSSDSFRSRFDGADQSDEMLQKTTAPDGQIVYVPYIPSW